MLKLKLILKIIYYSIKVLVRSIYGLISIPVVMIYSVIVMAKYRKQFFDIGNNRVDLNGLFLFAYEKIKESRNGINHVSSVIWLIIIYLITK